MFRSLQIVAPAVGLVAAVGIATIALTLDRPAPPTQPPAEVSRAAEVRPRTEPVVDTAAAEPTLRPTGAFTYLDGDGSYVTIDAGDPSTRLGSTEDLSTPPVERVDGEYPSPDGRYVASVRRDDTGVWIDILASGREIQRFGIAGPDDPQLLAGSKFLAAAVDGVPLNVAWSPDSRYLAYGTITDAPFSLAVTRTDTWSTLYRQVAGGYVGELAWAPDSSHLAISTYELDRTNHTVLIYDPATLSIRHLIDGCTIVWAPDATFLAVHREPSVATGIWLTSPDGETRIEATADKSAFPVAWVRRDS